MKRGIMHSCARTMLVQASWNYDRMVGVGVGYAMEPLLRDLPGGAGGTAYTDSLGRASQFFNAHPYLTGIAVGAIARAEHDEIPPDHVRRLRGAMVGPLGSLGDKLFWAGTLPTASGIGLFVAAVVSPLVGGIVFFLLYNVAHLAMRVWGIGAGWRLGTHIARGLGAPVIQRGLRLAGPAAAVAIGVALPPVSAWLVQDLAGNAQVGVALVAVVGIALSRWIAPAFGGHRFGLAAVVTAFLLGFAWA